MRRERLLAAIALGLVGCAPQVRFSDEEVAAAELGRGLPRDFLLGTATAAHQIEGGNTNNDWWRWEHSAFPDGAGHIHGGDDSLHAARSWDEFATRDIPAMEELGANAYRFSIEWSRLEPTRGAWDEAAAQRYRDWLRELRLRGIEPMVTLHHFTIPQWVEDQGGFENRATLDDFAAFAARAAQAFGAEVDLWCTVNEPNVYVVQGYIDGTWPPGKQDSKLAAEVMANLLEAHARAATQLRANDTVDADGRDGHATRIGLAHHVRVFQPASSSTLDQSIAAITDAFFNESIVQAAATGRIRISVPLEVEIDRPVEGLKGSFDYLGINYYTRDHVRADLSDEALSNQYVPSHRPRNDLGWDVYPEGLYLFLKRFSSFGWPLYVTENGIADADGDARSHYLRQHLYAVERAVAEGVDVRGYFHWSLMDNFEWSEGYSAKFGLYAIDRSHPELPRVKTPAVDAFREMPPTSVPRAGATRRGTDRS